MEKIRKHIESKYNNADNEYWKIYSILEKKKKELRILSNDIENLESSLIELDSERDEYQQMLNEIS
ncbi:MAG: hypothetical protein ACOCWG_04810 [bacterium]